MSDRTTTVSWERDPRFWIGYLVGYCVGLIAMFVMWLLH